MMARWALQGATFPALAWLAACASSAASGDGNERTTTEDGHTAAAATGAGDEEVTAEDDVGATTEAADGATDAAREQRQDGNPDPDQQSAAEEAQAVAGADAAGAQTSGIVDEAADAEDPDEAQTEDEAVAKAPETPAEGEVILCETVADCPSDTGFAHWCATDACSPRQCIERADCAAAGSGGPRPMPTRSTYPSRSAASWWMAVQSTGAMMLQPSSNPTVTPTTRPSASAAYSLGQWSSTHPDWQRTTAKSST